MHSFFANTAASDAYTAVIILIRFDENVNWFNDCCSWNLFIASHLQLNIIILHDLMFRTIMCLSLEPLRPVFTAKVIYCQKIFCSSCLQKQGASSICHQIAAWETHRLRQLKKTNKMVCSYALNMTSYVTLLHMQYVLIQMICSVA